MNQRVLRSSSNVSYLTAISGVEPPARATRLSQKPKAPAPTLAQNEAGSEIERSANDSTTSTDSEMPEVNVLTNETTEREEKSLLALRQQYKKTRTNIARVRSHLNFLQQCQEQQKTPKGLRVNVRCNALLADYTNVKEQFKTTKETAEGEFTTSLKEHYELIIEQLEQDLKELEATMTKELEKVDEEKRREHEDLLKKTTDNITKHEERLKERKKQKYDNLSNGEETRRRERRENIQRRQERQERPRGRGMPYQSRPKRQPSTQTTRPKTPPRPAPMETQPTQPPPSNIVQEVAEMRSLLNKLLLNQQANQVQQPPQLPGISHCPPMVPQHPSLFGPGGNTLPGQHPSLVRQGQQYFLPGDRLPQQQP